MGTTASITKYPVYLMLIGFLIGLATFALFCDLIGLCVAAITFNAVAGGHRVRVYALNVKDRK